MIVHLQITYQPIAKKRLWRIVEEAQGILAQQDGFLGLKKYTCLQENTVIFLLAWRSLEDFESSRSSPQWLFIAPDWSELIDNEEVTATMKYGEEF